MDSKEQEIIDMILPESSQAFLIDYYLNTLSGKKFIEGLSLSDYDIVLSTKDAEDSEIIHSLNICNSKFDPNTPPSRKVIVYEDLEEIMVPFANGKHLAESDFKEVTIHVYPKIRRNLRYDISSLNYKMVKEGKLVNYKMEHVNTNPENKDILCIVSFKLDGKKHKLEKILQLLEQFREFDKDFFESHRIAYIIFCVETENQILTEYDLLPPEIQKVNELYDKVRMIFYINPPGDGDDEILNVFGFNDLGKSYYFHMNSKHEIYRADDMLCSGDLIENSIKRKKKEKEDNERNKNKTPEQLANEKYEAFYNFYNFLKHIKDYKYCLYINFQFEICLKYDEDMSLRISYIDFYQITAELRTKEYRIIKKAADILNPDLNEVEEVPTIDIPIDFNDMECYRCSAQIGNTEDFYYCYKCKIKYCRKCVNTNFNSNQGLGKFIDPRHNLLYFKTRDLNMFKNIDLHKLGNDLFSQCLDSSKLVDHNAICNGCHNNFENSPRYLCLHCRPGKRHSDGYFDYCLSCVTHMMAGDAQGIEIQKLEERVYNEETRLLYYEDKEKYRHDNDKHIYLMIARQYNCNSEPYYKF